MNFLPKQLAITSLNNYKDSNERLKKKNDQLKVLMTQLDSDEEESKRISRISKKSYIMEKTAVKSVEVNKSYILNINSINQGNGIL